MIQPTVIKRKLKSIEKTRKITHAMRLISMSFYTKLEKKAAALEDYHKSIKDSFQEVLQYAKELKTYTPIKKNSNRKPLFILIASSKGLCGSFNSALFKFFKQNIDLREGQEAKLISVGQKATNFLHEENIGPILAHYNEFTTSSFYSIADSIVNDLLLSEHEYTSVTTFSNIFQNFFMQKPQKISLLPLEEESEIILGQEPIWEQQKQEVVEFMTRRYLRSHTLHLLFQSLISEQAARFLAMDNATKNANKFIDTLTLQYNKYRQALITKELAELSSGFASIRQ